jgi:hypothetical protein
MTGGEISSFATLGGLALIGVIASIAVSVKKQEEEAIERQAAKNDTEELVSDATAQALAQTPIALLGAVMTMPGGAAGALSAAPLLGRNWPLVLLLVMTGALFWPTTETLEDDLGAVRKLNGSDDHMASALRH